jgi:RND family efflux transporter MFP subunit
VPLVSTALAQTERGSLTVRGNGTVRPAQDVTLAAEVSGRLISVSDQLVSGGQFEEGDVLARIDPSDYRNAVEQARAQVTQAQFQVIQARQESEVARNEWERLQRQTDTARSPDSTKLGRLAYKEPQLRQAQANLRSAEANLANAQTRLERTYIRAPFDGQVREKQADRGTYVGPGTPVASIYSTDMAEVVVSLTSREAALIEGLWSARDARIPATVSVEYGGARFLWDGYVARVEGAVDTQSRTIDVVVRVPEPYATQPTVAPRAAETPNGPERPPLAVGQYTTVRIEARPQAEYTTVPRQAVHTRDPGSPVVWTVEGDSMLVERSVRIIQTVDDTAYLTAGAVANGTPVITSDLPVHADSMAVRVSESSTP